MVNKRKDKCFSNGNKIMSDFQIRVVKVSYEEVIRAGMERQLMANIGRKQLKLVGHIMTINVLKVSCLMGSIGNVRSERKT